MQRLFLCLIFLYNLGCFEEVSAIRFISIGFIIVYFLLRRAYLWYISKIFEHPLQEDAIRFCTLPTWLLSHYICPCVLMMFIWPEIFSVVGKFIYIPQSSNKKLLCLSYKNAVNAKWYLRSIVTLQYITFMIYLNAQTLI